MRPDLPWNVAGISSEAREAARAAARREGLSVGEWLTRRIVAGLSVMSEPHENRAEWTPRGEYRPEPERQRRDSDAMLDRVSRSESDTAEVYRRIEDQLRGMARRLDSSERSQTESNRVMSKAAVEMNIASREQAQAFDQLGAHVANIAERLDRVEGREPGEGLRDAVKALHQGLSRLADQISQTANQSATQISALANNLETVAGRVGQARHDSLVATQALEGRLAAIDERVRTLETATQSNAGSLERALETIEAQKRNSTPTEAITRLQDSIRRLEERTVDPGIDRRLGGIEKTLADVVAHIDPRDEPDSIEDSLRKIVQRLESLETTQREAAAEMRKAAVAKPAEEPPPPPVAPPPAGVTAGFSPMPAFEPPPFADAPPPFAAAFDTAAPPFADPLPAFEAPAEVPFTPPPGVVAPEATAPTVESYLAAARRSARMAAQAETERSTSIGGLRWGAKTDDDDGKKRTRPLLVGLAALVGIAVIAGAVLSRHAAPSQTNASVSLLDKRIATAKAPAVVSPMPLHPATETTPPSVVIKPAVAAKPAARPRPSGLMPSGIPPAAPTPSVPTQLAAVQPPPQQVRPATATPLQQARPAAPLDRLTTAANAGNPRAQLIVGLKYLDGDGIAANDGEAAKWLTRAADAGEPVAQYRLGTLYERGRGVPVDAAKAVRWYQAAANQGSRKAMHNLAVAFAEGAGVKKDFTEASRWFLKAANLGLSDSQFNLAVLYERGLGVPQNLVDAYKWYAIAASQGDTESKSRIAAIASQLDTEARAAAQHAADTFRPSQLDARANVAPTMASVTRG